VTTDGFCRVCYGHQTVLWRAVIFFISACAGRFVSRLTREFLFSVDKKETKKSCPHLGSTLRSDFPRSVAAPGAVLKGHPWPSGLSAAPGRYDPLRNDSTRPALKGRADQDQKPDQDQMPLTPLFVGASLLANPGKGNSRPAFAGFASTRMAVPWLLPEQVRKPPKRHPSPASGNRALSRLRVNSAHHCFQKSRL
jgi:hypothetical protein